MNVRTFRRQWLRRSMKSVAAITLLSGGASLSLAQSSKYASSRRPIRACVLVTPGANIQNTTPFVWFAMERREETKPAGWEFVNPLAPTTVTGEMYTRWRTRGGTVDPAFQTGTPDAALFQVGAQLTKNMAPYWEVDLSRIKDEDLRQFDVALLSFRNRTGIVLSPAERARLQRFVEGGGVLWVEAEDGNVRFSVDGALPIPVNFGATAGGGRARIATQRHPLISFPFSLSQFDIRNLGSYAGTHPAQDYSQIPAVETVSPIYPVLTRRGSGNYVSVADYGSGHLVFSSAGVATGVAGGLGGFNVEGPNSGVISGNNLLNVQQTDLRFAYNLVAYSSNAPTSAANSRRTGATSDVVGKDLGTRWATIPAGNNSVATSGTVVSKGIAYSVTTPANGNSVLHAYDLSPASDLDFNGNPDDGIQDFSVDAPYDEIWNQGLAAGRYSTPTVVTQGDTDYVAVTSSGGETRIFAVRGITITQTLTYPQSGSADLLDGYDTALGPLSVSAPAYSEGVLFAVTYNDASSANNEGWRIAPINIRTGGNVFNVDEAIFPTPLRGANAAPAGSGMPAPVSSVTVGFVQDEATGAVDKMVYVATRPTQNPVATQQERSQGRVYAFRYSTKNEPLVRDPNSATTFYPASARQTTPWYTGNIAELYPVVHRVTLNANGTTTSVLETCTFQYVGNRMVIQTLSPALVNQTLVADYTLNWTNGSVGATPAPNPQSLYPLSRFMALRTQTGALNGAGPITLTSGVLALSDQDTLIFNQTFGPNILVDQNTGDQVPPSRIYSMRDQAQNSNASPNGRGRNGTEVAWMFSPYAPADATGGGQSNFPIVPRLVYGSDGLDTSSTETPLSQFTAIGSPVVQNGIVYVLGQAKYNARDAVTVILALRANPTLTFQFATPLVLGTNGQAPQIVVTQPDLFAASTLTTQPAVITLTRGSGFTLDEATNTITLSNLRAGNGGALLDSINLALPLQVRVGNNEPELVIDPRTGRSKLDNLLWYLVIPQRQFDPTTTGNVAVQARQRLYQQEVTDGNALYGIFLRNNNNGQVNVPSSGPTVAGDALYFGTREGRIATVDLKGINASGNLVSMFDGERMRLQLTRVLTNTTTGATAGFPLNQPITETPLATSNTIAVSAPQGVAALDNRVTLISDAARLLEVDYGANAVSALSGTRSSEPIGGATGPLATVRVALARPNTVRRSNRLGDYIIADTGNNRIVRTDKSGQSTWELRTFNDDFRIADNSVTLSSPSDVQTVEERGENFILRNPVNGQVYTTNGEYFAVRYLIADTGNFRIVEVTDAYNEDGDPLVVNTPNGPVTMIRQVTWVSRSLSEQNSRLRYRSIQQFPNPTQGGDLYLIASVDNLNPSIAALGGASFGAGGVEQTGSGGSLVAFRRYRPNETPIAPAQDGDVAVIINSMVYGDPNTNTVTKRIPILNPTFFRFFSVRSANNAPESRYLVCDESGVYVLRPINGEAFIEWALTSESYERMTGRKLRPVAAQKLPQSDYDPVTNRFYARYLITNQYTGGDNLKQFYTYNLGNSTVGQSLTDSEVRGEVFEVRSRDYTTDLLNGRAPYANSYRYTLDALNTPQINAAGAIVWTLPKEAMVLKNGKYSVVRTIGSTQTSTSTALLEQPAYAERQN